MLAPSELGGRRGKVNDSTLVHSAKQILTQYPIAACAVICLLIAALLAIGFLFLTKRKAAFRIAALMLCVGTAGLGFLLIVDSIRRTPSANVMTILADTRLLLLLCFSLWAALMLYSLEHSIPARTMLAALILGVSAAASVAVFLFAVYFPARSACPFVFYTSLADALLLSALTEAGKPKPRRILTALFAVLFVFSLPLAINDTLQTDKFLQDRKAYLTALGAAQPKAEAIVEPVKPLTKYPACWPGDEEYFVIETGWYYGLSAVYVTEYANRP